MKRLKKTRTPQITLRDVQIYDRTKTLEELKALLAATAKLQKVLEQGQSGKLRGK